MVSVLTQWVTWVHHAITGLPINLYDLGFPVEVFSNASLRYHCSLFPNTRGIEPKLINDLQDMITCACYSELDSEDLSHIGANMTHIVVTRSEYTTITSTTDQLKTVLEAITTAKGHFLTSTHLISCLPIKKMTL